VFVLGQGLGMESVLLMGKSVIFHLSLMKRLLEEVKTVFVVNKLSSQ